MKFPFGSYLSKDDVEQYQVPSELLAGISDYDFKVTELSGKFLTIPYLWGGTSCPAKGHQEQRSNHE